MEKMLLGAAEDEIPRSELSHADKRQEEQV